jgi:hypothetical protein
MKLAEKVLRWFAIPTLTKQRIWFAFSVAALTDAFQMALGPLGWVFLVDDLLDVVAMVLITFTLGFHPLLLPTFIIEAFPVADMLPTWTACTAAVVMLRKRAQGQGAPVPPRIVSGSPVTPPALPAPGSTDFTVAPASNRQTPAG